MAGKVAADHEVYRHYHRMPEKVPGGRVYAGDLGNFDHVTEMSREIEPEIIINCAALADVDGCEKKPEKSRNINVTAVEQLLDFFPQARFVQISTDYVFGDDDKRGSRPPRPDDITCPMNVYGRHKLMAEKATVASSPRNLIIRVNTLLDFTEKRNFFRLVYDRLQAGKEIDGIDDQVSNPISTLSAVDLIWQLTQNDTTGIFHVGGGQFVSRYGLAVEMARHFDRDDSLVRPVASDQITRPARRPQSAGLDCRATEKFLQISMPKLTDELERLERAMTSDSV